MVAIEAPPLFDLSAILESSFLEWANKVEHDVDVDGWADERECALSLDLTLFGAGVYFVGVSSSQIRLPLDFDIGWFNSRFQRKRLFETVGGDSVIVVVIRRYAQQDRCSRYLSECLFTSFETYI